MGEVKRKKSRKRLTIGYLISWVHDPIFQIMWAGVDDVARKYDVNLLCFLGGPLQSPHYFVEQRNIIYDLITEENLDGLIIASAVLGTYISPEEFEAFYRKYRSLPIVSVAQQLKDIPSVVIDNEQGMRSAVTHLLETHGLTRIAFIQGQEGHYEAASRYRAYTDALAEHGIPLDPDLVTPGDFVRESGAEAVRILLDQRNLSPGVGFEAIVAANDDMALGALAALQARGIRVPDDVALVGFDDREESKCALPPLTTVRNPFYKLGAQAAETLMAQLEGRDTPECVILPSGLVIRRSCGCCALPTVARAAAWPTTLLPAEDLQTLLVDRCESVLPALAQAVETSVGAVGSEWAEQLLDAFVGEMDGGKPKGIFLAALEGAICQTAASGLDVFAWQDALSVLYNHVLPYLGRDDAIRAGELLGQARAFVGDMARRLQEYRAVQQARQTWMLSNIEHALNTSFDMTELLDAAVEEIPKAGIPSFYIALFEDPGVSTDWSRLLLAYDGEKRIELGAEGRRFPSRQLLPDGLLPKRRYSLALEPLYLRNRQLGFALFEARPSQAAVCEALRRQISSMLQGVLLLQAREEAEAALEKAYAEVEKQVKERTTELQQEIAERRGVEAERERLLRALERRSTHLQTAAEVSRAASSILDPDELIRQVVSLVRERLDLYYTGLFLVDRTGEWTRDHADHAESNEWAALRAGVGAAGRQMLEQGYKLEVGGPSTIGWCIANKQARITSYGDEDAAHKLSLLPETRSELALPLMSRGQAIGAMTIQSTQEGAFFEEDIAVLQAMADQLANAIENARLYEQAQRELGERKRAEKALKHRLEQLAALSQASQAVTASLEPDQVLAEIVSLANEVVDSDYTGVLLVDDEGNMGQSAENLPGVQALEYRVREDGFTSWIVRMRRAVIVDEIDDDGAVHPPQIEGAPRQANPRLTQAGVKSFAGLPLMVKDRLLGVLYLHSLQPRAFGGQLFLLTAFANQVAIALENARLFQAEQGQTQRLALLADVARIVATTFDADTLLQAVAESIFRHFDYPRVGLFTLDDERRTLILRGRSSKTTALDELAVPGFYRLPIEQGVSGHVARTGKSHLAVDVSADPYFVNPTQVPTQSALGVPILEEDAVVGTMIVESGRLAAFDEKDQALLEATADTVAIGLRNARLYQETRRRVQELMFLNSISIGPGTVSNLDIPINTALKGLHELIGGNRVGFITVNPSTHSWAVTHEWAAPGFESSVGLNGSFDGASVELATLLKNRPFTVFDAIVDPQPEATQEICRSLGIESLGLAPVLVGGRLYGVLGVDHPSEKHVWHPDDIRLLEAVAHQLGLILENTHLFEEAQRRTDELASALTQLEEMDRLKDEFIQNVSHELRSPLALIRGYAEMLDSGDLGEVSSNQQKSVAIIARRARMLSDLVKDITLILEAEVSPPGPEPIPLDELAQNAVEDFQVEIAQADLTLKAEIEPGLPPVSGALVYMRRVLDNLIGNAVKFTPAGGTITVRLRQEGDQVALEVSDTGVGIPADKLERVFERFYQVDGSARRRYGGMGLGLALVKEIVEAYGGRVTVESQVDKGSAFTAYIPIFADASNVEKRNSNSDAAKGETP
jgi:signal transduction histidine kinase/DNA-binding LacI/PurR family transcriptional regulator/putative methionine-R-sulfoxide reductase with GAF domain